MGNDSYKPVENVNEKKLPGFKWYLLAPLIACIGGFFGILAALFEEMQYGGLLPAFIAAPVIEEVVKPMGVYLLLAKWPYALRGRLYTALLAALGALVFAIIENTLYLFVYFPDHSAELVLWRYTVALGMHVLASFIVGFGINARLLASVKGEIPLMQGNLKYFLGGILLHAAYNITATVLTIIGVISL